MDCLSLSYSAAKGREGEALNLALFFFLGLILEATVCAVEAISLFYFSFGGYGKTTTWVVAAKDRFGVVGTVKRHEKGGLCDGKGSF